VLTTLKVFVQKFAFFWSQVKFYLYFLQEALSGFFRMLFEKIREFGQGMFFLVSLALGWVL